MTIQDFLTNNKIELYMKDKHAADIAEELASTDVEVQKAFFRAVGSEIFANVLVEYEEEQLADIINEFSVSELIAIITHMQSDDAVDTLGYINFGKQKEVLKNLKKNERSMYNFLLGYDRDSAGGIMITEYVVFKNDLTVSNVFEKLRNIDINSDYYFDVIYLVDRHKKLVGYVKLKSLVLANLDDLLVDIMEDHIASVKASDDQEDVANIVRKYDLSAVPVVNNIGNILGIITVDDIIDVIYEEQNEDMLMMGGVISDQLADESVFNAIKARLPWLIVNLFTAFLSAFVVSRFNSVIAQVVVLASVMPIVAGMGGNAGTQALAVMIRKVAIYDVDLKTMWMKCYKEVIIGIINGFVIGVIGGIVLGYLNDNMYIGLLLLIAMMGNLVIAGFFGFMIPLVLKQLRFDPALASSIFITTATDIFGFLLFLGLATLFLPYLT